MAQTPYQPPAVVDETVPDGFLKQRSGLLPLVALVCCAVSACFLYYIVALPGLIFAGASICSATYAMLRAQSRLDRLAGGALLVISLVLLGAASLFLLFDLLMEFDGPS